MTSRTAQKRRRVQDDAASGDPLARALRSRGPRCECRHGAQRCRRQAAYRCSVLCADHDCTRAVHVSLACAPCKVEWLWHYHDCDGCPEVRVTPL